MKKVKILKTNISEVSLTKAAELLTTTRNTTVAVCNANSEYSEKSTGTTIFFMTYVIYWF